MRELAVCLTRKLLSLNAVKQPDPRAAGQIAQSTERLIKMDESEQWKGQHEQAHLDSGLIVECSERWQTPPQHQSSLLLLICRLVGEGWCSASAGESPCTASPLQTHLCSDHPPLLCPSVMFAPTGAFGALSWRSSCVFFPVPSLQEKRLLMSFSQPKELS